LEWLVNSCEDETGDDFDDRSIIGLIVIVAEAVREILEQNIHALIFGMTASHLSSILEVATATGVLIEIRSQFAKTELTPEWQAWFNRWVAEDAAFQDESLSASQAQPSSAGKQQIPCRHWVAEDAAFHDECLSASQAQPSSAGKQQIPCRHFKKTGACPWGDSCRFGH
jgi:hypothetical protein